MDAYNMTVLTNIIGAVESGGQEYGRRNYAAYADPYQNTTLEHTITLGWAQNYGDQANNLVTSIFAKDTEGFRRLDKCNPSIESMLFKAWEKERWNPTKEQKKVLIALIDSKAGHEAQDELFQLLMGGYIEECAKDYTPDVKATMMYCEIRHLGGKSAADRIFKRCDGNYSLDRIMQALATDQADKSSNNQVGDLKFWSRHRRCREFIEKYAREKMEPMERAKIFLRQQGLKVMTGYTPTGAQCFKDAGAWTKTPKPGYVVYFYGKPAGENYRICHTGLVEWVDKDGNFGTIEGNTSGGAFTTNGGSVARHTYSYKNVGGTNRVNGFGAPDFERAGITAEQFIAAASYHIGYEEKATNAYLDGFHRNAGRNNFQKFERDVIGYTGDQWCQYFVDACALYAARGEFQKGKQEVKCMVEMKEIKKGAAGQAVKIAQALLIYKFGISCGTAGSDGEFGDATERAVKEFQKMKDLDADGIIGKDTWTALID